MEAEGTFTSRSGRIRDCLSIRGRRQPVQRHTAAMVNAGSSGKPSCFVAMPITLRAEDLDTYDGDADHWSHVMESLFVKAIDEAGFKPIRPVAKGAHLIHGLIIRHLSTADLVLVDLSSHNPNVFFELGVRTSLNLPIALVRDEHTKIPFDTSGINTHEYNSKLRGWEILEEQQSLMQHIRDSVASCSGENPLWRQFGLTIRAEEPEANESPLEAKIDLLNDRVRGLQARLDDERDLRADLRAAEVERRLSEAAVNRPTWDDLARTPARELFASAVRRFVQDRFDVHFGFLGPNETVVEIGGGASASDLARIRELARRYEVVARLRPYGRPDEQGDPEASA